MSIIRKSTETRTGISVVRVGDALETYNILGERLHAIEYTYASLGIFTHRWFVSAFDEEAKEIMAGHFVDAFLASKCTKILADVSSLTVSWDGMNDWMRDELMPRLYAGGLRSVAVFIATDPSESNRYAAERFQEDNRGVNTAFTSEAAAVAWLKGQP